MQKIIDFIKVIYTKLTTHSKRTVLIFFGVILIAGAVFVPTFGISWDEIQENDIMLSNVKEYVSLFGGNKAVQDLKLSSVENITTSIERDHGEAVFYVTSPLTLIFPDSPRSLYLVKHCYTFLIFFGAMICLYLLLKNLTKRRIFGILGVLMLFLSPRFFAESFYNVKDVVLLNLVIISFYFGYKFVEEKKFIWAIWFAVACAFTANTRVIGFWLIGLVGLLYIIMLFYYRFAKKISILKPFLVGVSAVGIFLAVYYVITPAAWHNPVEFFKYTYEQSLNFNRWKNFVLYQGNVYNNQINPLPWHYIPVMIAITTPIVTLLLIISGMLDSVISIFRKNIKTFLDGDRKYYLLMLIFLIVPLYTSIVKKSNVYNGWRHFYFMYGPMIVLAVGAVKSILEVKKPIIKKAVVGVICAQLVFSGGWIVLHTGLQFDYFNFLAINCEKNYEQDYWNVSMEKSIEMIVDSADKNEVVTISALDFYSYDGLRKGVMMLPEKYAKRVKIFSSSDSIKQNTKYFFVNTTYKKLIEMEYENYPNMQAPFDYQKNFDYYKSLKIDGRSIIDVYTAKNQ